MRTGLAQLVRMGLAQSVRTVDGADVVGADDWHSWRAGRPSENFCVEFEV